MLLGLGCGDAWTSKVISLGGLLHSGCKVNFEVGRLGDHQFGGVIEHPNGTSINMIYTKGIWCLPVLTKEKAKGVHSWFRKQTTP
eukprot:2565753-Rhodomonas_salina.1